MAADLPTRAVGPALVSWQLRRPPVEIFFFFFPQFIHVNRAKYQKFRDFSLRMYIGQILPAVGLHKMMLAILLMFCYLKKEDAFSFVSAV